MAQIPVTVLPDPNDHNNSAAQADPSAVAASEPAVPAAPDDPDRAFVRQDRVWFKEGDEGREPDTSDPNNLPAEAPNNADPNQPSIWKGGPGPNEHEPGIGLVEPYIDVGSGFGRR